MRTWFCTFCLETWEGEVYPLDACPACRMGRCTSCNTRLKMDMDFCFGCGKIKPDIVPSFSDSNSISGVYAQERWRQESLFRHFQREKTHYPYFLIMSGWHKERKDYKGVFLVLEDSDGKRGDVRELNDEERVSLGYPPLSNEKSEKRE